MEDSEDEGRSHIFGTHTEDGKNRDTEIGNGRQHMEMRADEEIEVEGVGMEWCKNTLLDARATGWLTQEDIPGDTMIVDAQSGFNDLIRLAVLLAVRHYWPSIHAIIGRNFSSSGQGRILSSY